MLFSRDVFCSPCFSICIICSLHEFTVLFSPSLHTSQCSHLVLCGLFFIKLIHMCLYVSFSFIHRDFFSAFSTWWKHFTIGGEMEVNRCLFCCKHILKSKHSLFTAHIFHELLKNTLSVTCFLCYHSTQCQNWLIWQWLIIFGHLFRDKIYCNQITYNLSHLMPTKFFYFSRWLI